MAADDRGGILVDVDGDAGAQLLEGQAALARLSVAHGEVGVVDVGLVHPDDAAQHDPVQVAGYRGEHAVPPLEGRLVGDAAQLGRALDGDVVAHEPDEGDPGRGGRLATVLEGGAGEGGEPPAAAAHLVNDFSEQQGLVGGEASHERFEGVHSSHMDLPHPPERPPGGIVFKQRSGWVLGQILCLAGKSVAFGDLPVPESSSVIKTV